MNTLLKYCLAATLALSVTACKKYTNLDIENPNRVDESNFWKTSADAVQGINAVYGNFYRNGAPYSRWLPFYMDIRSDDGYSTSPWNELRSVGALNITQYSFEVNYDTWWHHYRGVYRANQVLANVPNITMDDALKTRILGEAKFLRAVYYYNLINIWGNIPLILEPSTPADKPSQATQEQVWAQIEKDLTDATQALPLSYTGDEIGRATKGAAYGFLARSYMQQKKWQQAADALQWLITGPGAAIYDLVPNFRDNFLHTTENNKESVFEVQFKMRPENGGDDGPTSNVGTSRPPFFAPPGHGFNDANMHRWVVWEFLTEKNATGGRDPRLAVTALYDSTDERGPNFTIVYGSTFTSKNYDANIRNRVWYHKYLDDYFRINEFEVFNSPINFRALRFGDVLLMYAEALNNLNRTAEAYAFVDRVRQRSGMAKLSVTRPGMTQAQFQQQLEHERITELTGESVRWNDLARWGYFDDAAKLALLKARDSEFNNFVIGRNKYMPIPQSEIDINPNLKQNPNW
ncbi:MAG TPA: RagB/SusD family nutrient uptake outer membrane protein [Chitinophagaceae bacterium]|nr:RagB/SusD family nutrient uptake outer membrane protein [Chitinophagaceae bacterium]